MKAQIPDALKADVPQTTFGKILTATPVVLTVVATLLAGLASSEMTRAQYDRSLAAQLQSRAGDQWAFFQAKRLRGTMNDVVETILATRDDAPSGGQLAAKVSNLTIASETKLAALELLRAAEEGRAPFPLPLTPENIRAALDAVDSQAPAEVLVPRLHEVSHDVLDQEIDRLRQAVREADDRAGRDSRLWAELEKQAKGDPGWRGADRSALQGMHLSFEAQRYADEARMNQRIAQVLELKVRKVNLSAERHHLRSVRFFYGMLAAQVAVIVSTLALAAKAKNWLWSVAAAAGFIALALGVYVHLYL